MGAGEAAGHAALAPRRQRPARRPPRRCRRRVEDALVGAGLSEAVGWSFAAPDLADRLRLGGEDLRGRPVRLRNPMSEEQSTLRTTLLGSLLDGVAPQPLARDARRPAVRGRRDLPRHAARRTSRARRQPLPDERTQLGALLTGALRPPSWREPRAAARRLLRRQGRAGRDARRDPRRWAVEPASEPFLHPGRAARVLVGGEPAGWLGELHPAVAAGWDVEQAAGFELELGRARAPRRR